MCPLGRFLNVKFDDVAAKIYSHLIGDSVKPCEHGATFVYKKLL